MAGDVTVAVVSGTTGSSGGGTADFTKSGFGTPKACIVISSLDGTDDTSVAVQSAHSIGFSDFTNHYCITHQDEDASAKVDCDALKSNTTCYSILNTSGSVQQDGTASAITDGVRLTNSAGSGGIGQQTVIMFGGADLAVDLRSSSINSSQNGIATITHSGFTDGNDKLIFFIGADISGEDSASSGINNSFGVCHATGDDTGGWTFVQRCMGWTSDHNNTVGSPSAIISTDRVLDIITEAGTQDWGLEVTALDHSPAEWTVTTRDNGSGSGMEVYSLALDLDDRGAKVGSVDSPTSGATWTPSVSLGFTPQYVGLGLTRHGAENAIVVGNQAAGAHGISSNTGSGEETCHSWYNEDAATTTNTNNLFRSRAIDYRTDDTVTVSQDHSHSSFNSGGWTYTINTENETTAHKWIYWAIEEAAVGATVITVPAPKAYSLTKFEPTIQTGVNIAVPTPKAFSLTKIVPAAGTSVDATVPAPKAYIRNQFLPTIETGVTIIVPAPKNYTRTDFLPALLIDRNIIVPTPKAYSLSGILPSVGTGLIVTIPVPKAYTLAGIEPTINLGVNVVAPAPKGYTLAGQLPIVGTGVDIAVPVPKNYVRAGFEPVITTAVNINIIVPAPKTYTLAGQLPTIETGVTVITPLGAFTRNQFLPTIQTGVAVIVPAPKAYSLAGFEPLISIGVEITVPAPKSYTLAGLLPGVASGANIVTPLGTFTIIGFAPGITTLGAVDITVPLGGFNLTKFAPNAGAGVIIVTPLGAFTVTGFDPVINIGVNIITPLGAFTRTDFDPVIGTGLDVQVPLKTFTLNNFVPGVASGVGIAVPLKTYTRTDFVPQIGTGAVIVTPLGTFTITGFEPFVEKVVEVRTPLKEFNLTAFDPAIHSNRPPLLAASILDLTPPFDDITQMRYLFRNFAVLRDLLNTGVDGQFTTSDGKTALVRGGIIVDLY